MKGTAQFKSVFRPSSGSKTIIFCTGTEAEMNNAVEVIKESIQGSGGMSDPSDPQVCVVSLQKGKKISVLCGACLVVMVVVVVVGRGGCWNVGQ